MNICILPRWHTHIHRLKILQYCKIKGERKVKPIYLSVKVKELFAQSCPTLCDPWTVAHQAPLSMGFSREECWSGPLLQGTFPTQGFDPSLPHCRQISYRLKPPGKPIIKKAFHNPTCPNPSVEFHRK